MKAYDVVNEARMTFGDEIERHISPGDSVTLKNAVGVRDAGAYEVFGFTGSYKVLDVYPDYIRIGFFDEAEGYESWAKVHLLASGLSKNNIQAIQCVYREVKKGN